jgi:metal-responsive CopG/Arc/MetJ family transcriptional regulator
VEKTTIYLPRELKESLRRVAAAQGSSEAELIREAIAERVGRERPHPRGGLFSSGDPSLSEQVDEALRGFGER